MNEEWLRAGVVGGLELALALALAPCPSVRPPGRVATPAGPMPTPEAHPDPQALPEQQDMSWPACPWKEAAYQRGKDTLFRPGHLPGLGVPCSGPGRQSWPLRAGRSQGADWDEDLRRADEQVSVPWAMPGPRVGPLSEVHSSPPFPSTILLPLHSFPTSLTPDEVFRSLTPFIHLNNI